MIQIERYDKTLKSAWDSFNQQAINGTFFFNRNFIEYHADRFIDHSLLFYRKDQLIAILPLHEKDGVANSHQGLSFGGFVVSRKVDTLLMLQVFRKLREYLKSQLFHTLFYKAQPSIYAQEPAQEDLVALYQHGASLYKRANISVLDLTVPLHYSKLRQRCLKKALENSLTLAFSNEVEEFMNLVEIIHATAGIRAPTHTTAELRYLKELFPENIKLLTAYQGEELIGGVILFEHRQVVNLQYMATSPKGKKVHALDLLLHHVIQVYKSQKKYLSFGTSYDDREPYGLSQNLLRNKTSYGTRTVVQDTYYLFL
ncbi:GNAT family N-acetyltransferase [Adhaeribacter radiodurans]|uniref:GNAT family N-acetyltransferase n=1 Tax=Adhaeribacter radiodurans TaxID=2745197 RepID=A0A7L7L559_9BACT|nr:GNAT family N-acetyltransferase [Adhaeribacter radiodurans]QMU27937.1 GNAT family N-acetyltransferase [Adhaeribacter radiodurans]